MKLKTLSEKEFQKFADNNPEITFYQTKSWAHLKKKNGWIAHYLGLEDKNNLVAASLILAKTLPIIKKKMFYAPRGFLIDYKDKEILKEFTNHLKNYAKKNTRSL